MNYMYIEGEIYRCFVRIKNAEKYGIQWDESFYNSFDLSLETFVRIEKGDIIEYVKYEQNGDNPNPLPHKSYRTSDFDLLAKEKRIFSVIEGSEKITLSLVFIPKDCIFDPKNLRY